jgi:uncharacterized protein
MQFDRRNLKATTCAIGALLLLIAPRVARADDACVPQAVHAPVAVKGPHSTLKLWVVADTATRGRGLMCVRHLDAGTGMIFVFSGGDYEREFWMKDTLIPLDMVWVDHDGRVTGVAAQVPQTTVDTPDELIPRRNGIGTYVIELGAGDAARQGIVVGSHLDVRPAGSAKE